MRPRCPQAKRPSEPYLAMVRALVEAYFAFVDRDAKTIRRHGLTPSQFDVVATLGNTPGMTCRELSAKTLVTKGTLTGVLDRLASRGVVERLPSPRDRRSIHVRLTAEGARLFRRSFPAVVGAMRPYFERALGAREARRLRTLLARLKQSLETPLEESRKETRR
ncbi:MAG: MarR family transcriptional regulator [Deltaproteobacteria bacterium]|nr:MarR family transcriptional regulator [Deltaproteobacteria bacterium]